MEGRPQSEVDMAGRVETVGVQLTDGRKLISCDFIEVVRYIDFCELHHDRTSSLGKEYSATVIRPKG